LRPEKALRYGGEAVVRRLTSPTMPVSTNRFAWELPRVRRNTASLRYVSIRESDAKTMGILIHFFSGYEK
jgi:hypothetical protein